MITNIRKITYPLDNPSIFGETQTSWDLGENQDLSINAITDKDIPGVANIFIAEHYAGSTVGETMVWENEFSISFALAAARLLAYDYEISFIEWKPSK